MRRELIVLVSVLMSLYKPDLTYLAEQLASIEAQTCDDMEVVIYNDCPEGEDLGAWCAEQCPSRVVRYEHGERNLGYVKAFEHLVGLAQGEYVAFCDQDDRWLPDRIQACLPSLEEGCVLCSCDRAVIDGDGEVVVPSWRAAHPKDVECRWHTGDYYVPQAVFTCFSIGMATMMRTSVARELAPYPLCTGHDKWLALCGNEVGRCAFVDKPLVQYRRHTSNVSGTLSGMTCKADWYKNRTEQAYRLAHEFCTRFPQSQSCEQILSFAEARHKRNVWGIWRGRHLAPIVAYFEIGIRYMPDFVFRKLFARG